LKGEGFAGAEELVLDHREHQRGRADLEITDTSLMLASPMIDCQPRLN
jgi:hypothetical protein